MSVNIIQGVYYDGITNTPRKADITITHHGIKISFPRDSERNEIRWDHYKIHSSDIPGSQKVCLNYVPYPDQSVEVDRKNFISILKNVFPQAPYLSTIKRSSVSKGLVLMTALFGGFITLAVVVYFVLIPLATNLAIKAIPVETEVNLGKQMAEKALATEQIDQAKTSSINKFLNHLEIKSRYPIQVTVVNSEVKNAFAIPGGQIVLYSALLNEMEDYSELVALLGHEIAHVEERHTLKMLGKSVGLYLVVSAVFQDVSGLIAVLLDNASALERLSYNRALETEADEIGLKIVEKNKVDPRGMIKLFNHLKQDNNATITPEFLNSHPSLVKRIETLKGKLPELNYTIAENDSLSYYWQQLKR